MNRKLTLSFVIYAACAVVMIAIGLSFELRSEFMPFHSDVIQTEWPSVDAKFQILFLGMMKTEGAGFLATATALSFMLWFPFRKFERWSYWAMTVVGVVECLPSFLANYYVASVTSASPPWWLMLALMLSLTLALLLATMGHNERLKNTY